MNSYSLKRKIPNNDIPQFKLPTSNEKKSYISTATNHINPYHRREKTMNKKQEQQILDYYSATDKSVARHTPMRIGAYLPKKTINTSVLCWNRKASVKLR